HLKFIDSLAFMNSSIDSLAKNLDDKKKIQLHNFCKENKFRKNKFKLLSKKGIYPYEYMNSREKYDENKLPPREAFYSNLTGKHISRKDYRHAKKIWKKFDIKSMKQYTELYNTVDVLLLHDVFTEFRKVCYKAYGLDPLWYVSAPGLSWDAMLKLTEVKLETLSDPTMYSIFERGIRGGVCHVPKRSSEANHEYLESYDPNQPKK